jgi:hypothetical protein
MTYVSVRDWRRRYRVPSREREAVMGRCARVHQKFFVLFLKKNVFPCAPVMRRNVIQLQNMATFFALGSGAIP